MSKVRVLCILAGHLTCAVSVFNFCEYIQLMRVQFFSELILQKDSMGGMSLFHSAEKTRESCPSI